MAPINDLVERVQDALEAKHVLSRTTVSTFGFTRKNIKV